ncbi:hypothetical protein [Mesorhizobium sp. B1-1-7]|uniref:hypothetical protein n=1 Tax=Mesorhizobium sp. B1-1-7 TaxID=2589977 RepID=UPI00112867CD|nr:hypothetical protein [Mesorhizobium sp. B1-1-7]TPN44861.1 hypothetical protein FJ978_28180 [Mesorhizobium sp. B1-1-7]
MVDIRGLSDPWRAGRNSSGARIQLLDSGGNGTDVLNRILARVPAKDTSGDADFRFGKASRFTLTTPDQPTNPGATVTWPPDDRQNDPSNPIVIDDFDYIDRSVEKIKVVNKDDPEQYVIVERILKIMFVDRQTGRYKRFSFDWSKTPSETTDNTGG